MAFSDPISNVGDSFGDSDRRQCARQAPGSLSYVHLDEHNGGILINLSESGLAVQAAMAVMEDDLPRLRLQMPRSKTWLETTARVVWTGDARRTVGVEFLNSTEDFRKHLREWLAAEAGNSAAAVEAAHTASETHNANVEEMPLRSFRPSAQQRALHSAEFDVAALSSPRETASVAVARSLKVQAEHTHTATAIGAPLQESASAIAETHDEKRRERRSGGYVALVIALAALSLAAGWEAARGNVFQTVRALFLPSSAAATTTTARPARSAIANGLATNFEVIDANNQAWLVLFSGPTAAPAGPALPALPPKAAASLNEPPANPVNAFKASNLAAPRLSARSSAAGGSAAPVVATPQGGALPSAIAESGPNFGPAPPPQTTGPTQEVHSSLVEPKLIRSVQPNYPTVALSQHVEGQVKVHARIEEDGSLSNVSALSGPPLLISAAVNAVREWKYKPEILDGRPVASDVVVTIQFTVPH